MVKHDMAAPEVLSRFPFEIFSNHLAILGKTGSGKTTAAKGFAEHLMDSGRRVCAIDPTGVWWGLRVLADGKRAGYPPVIFGGDHADVDLGEQSGSRLAETVADGAFSCVIDTSLMTVGARTRLFTDFAEALFRANKRPLHLVIDEAHVFAPQGRVPDPQSGRMLHAANNLVSGGRARGLRIMLISQRPAKLHKDSLTQVETLIAMRLIAPQDRAAVEAWIGEWADPKQGKDIILSLPSLARGDGWVWSPEVGMLERISFPAIKTFDSSRAPEDGELVKAPVDLAAVNIDEICSALEVNGGGAEQQKRVVSNKLELEEAERLGFVRGYEKGLIEGRKVALKDVKDAVEELARHEKQDAVGLPGETDTTRPVAGKGKKDSTGPQQAVTAPQQRILDAMAKLEALGLSDLHKVQVAAVAGVSPNSGSYANNLGRLRTMGLIDYPQGGLVVFTQTGRKAANRIGTIPTLGDLHEAWYSIVTHAQQRILREIIAAYPEALPKEKLAKRIDVSPDSGSYANNLGRLRTLGAITYPRPGYVKAVGRSVPKRKAA